MTTKETLNLVSDKILREIVTELTEKVDSLQHENAVLKSKNSSLLETQRIRDEAMLKTTSLIESLRSEVTALRSEAESEQIKKKMESYLSIYLVN